MRFMVFMGLSLAALFLASSLFFAKVVEKTEYSLARKLFSDTANCLVVDLE